MIIPLFIPHAGCPHQCVFCNQKEITGHVDADDAAAIPGRINRYLGTHHGSRPVRIAFYGGSFTALPLERQKAYLESISPFLLSGRVESIRISTRPDCIRGEVLSLLSASRVTVVELGVQSMDDRVLTRSGRGHTAADTTKAVAMLRDYGFSVGLQLMPGLPGDSEDIFRKSVLKTLELKPDFVRLYPTLVIKGTPLEGLYCQGRYVPLSLDDAVAICRDAYLRFERHGIRVIRMGLQPTEDLEKPGTILAGPHHPAFGQLVETSIFLDEMRQALRKKKERTTNAVFLVNSGDVSKAVGQRRANIEILKEEFGLREISIREIKTAGRRKNRIELVAS